MRIAVFHNFLDNIGGAEIVTLTLARELNADIYTTNICAEKISLMGFNDLLPKIKSIGKVPKNAPFRQQLAFFFFRNLNLNGQYDFFIISGDWAQSGAVKNKPNLWYIHFFLHELWEFKNYIRKELLSVWKRPLYDIWVYINRHLSLSYAKHVDQFITNSKNTQERVRKYYGRESVVINPPIDTASYRHEVADNYWLSVNRLFKNKRVEMQIEAFREMSDQKLVIVGSYEKGSINFERYRRKIESELPTNVIIKNWVSNNELKDLYSKCKGFVTTSRSEDFGMTAVEAMASGKPVIAPNEGGYKETIKDGENGILITDITSDKLKDAILKMEANLDKNPYSYKDVNISKALSYDTKRFIKEIKSKIKP